MKWTLPARPPFSLPAVVGSHGWVQLAPFATDETYSHLTVVDHLSSGRVVELRLSETPGGIEVEARVPLDAVERDEVSRRVTWMLALDQDLSAFYDAVRSEPKLAHVADRAQGRLLRSPTLFDDTVKTILTTNTAWSGTKRMVSKLVTRFGAALPSDPERSAFPIPEELAATDEQTLRADVGLGYRAPYVLALSRAVASGDLELESYKSSALPTDELYKALLAIKGVGPYAAAHLLMLVGRYDFLPIDSWACKLVSHEWHGGEPVGKAEVARAFEHWGPWRGLVYWFWAWDYTSNT